jgi:hypothetical protein
MQLHPPKRRAWVDKNPRVHFYFVLTSSCWAIHAERLFSELTQRQIRRLVTHSVNELIEAITHYLDKRNLDPKPFVWTTTIKSILVKVAKAKKTLATLGEEVLRRRSARP